MRTQSDAFELGAAAAQSPGAGLEARRWKRLGPLTGLTRPLLHWSSVRAHSSCCCPCCCLRPVAPPALRRLRPFYVHQWLDVRDTQHSWLEAQVLAVDPPDPLHSDAASAAILEAHPPPAPAAATSASASPLPEAAAASSSSSPPPPPASQSDQRWIRVHYKGFASKYDEWLDVSSDRSADMLRRIAPLHAHTRIPHPQLFPPCFNNIGDKIDCKVRPPPPHTAPLFACCSANLNEPRMLRASSLTLAMPFSAFSLCSHRTPSGSGIRRP